MEGDNLKKTIFLILLVVISAYLFIFQWKLAPRPIYSLITNSIDLSKENISGLKLHQDINSPSFIKEYGKIQSLNDNNSYDYFNLKNGLVIATDKNSHMIIRIIVNDNHDKKLVTQNGIKLGDLSEKVVKLYGKNYYKRQEQGTDILGYIDKKNQTTLEFWCVENKIQMIRLDIASIN
ncbi:hypothetical protein HMPREF0083_01876 [Aneurinibacillus aneurinilyticus ATCC 12856]|jgi:hypothetical protein|uniref:Uncharacterized protein n=1 Tax=Aneurinibacillus aneurinilyticus ATCC 12856 TaxID=649747 RepID=U1X4Y5_ANEAE|nr:hypothetical protein HMPREF0083_01876 [Aneurinibacillus aneurinilyticus ATCC 12856]